MKKNFIKDETFWTVFLGTIGCFALLWNLLNNPSDWPNIIVNFAQIGVAVIVFFIANNIFKDLMKKKSYGFNEKFEQFLLEWAEQNKYLIDATNINEEKGKDGKRTIDMIVNHENFVKGTLLASEVSAPKNKGAFLYLPLKKDLSTSQVMQFKINKGMFSRRADLDYETEKNSILENIANRINFEFSSIGIRAKKSSDAEKIDVDFSKLEKTDENAKRLIDVVEFVKTTFLAIA
ncbi:MAG: hypothetical protein GYA62_17775 [Bacteroidales bacterium]|nr:hypothetical protein [Bacteroidales bacterium]